MWVKGASCFSLFVSMMFWSRDILLFFVDIYVFISNVSITECQYINEALFVWYCKPNLIECFFSFQVEEHSDVWWSTFRTVVSRVASPRRSAHSCQTVKAFRAWTTLTFWLQTTAIAPGASGTLVLSGEHSACGTVMPRKAKEGRPLDASSACKSRHC